MILTPLQKLPNNLGKIIVATGFDWLPKVQKIALSGHTDLLQRRDRKFSISAEMQLAAAVFSGKRR